MEKLWKYIVFRFSNCCSKMVEIRRAGKRVFWCSPSLLMDLGQDQQQHPTVHSVGIIRGMIRGCGC